MTWAGLRSDFEHGVAFALNDTTSSRKAFSVQRSLTCRLALKYLLMSLHVQTTDF